MSGIRLPIFRICVGGDGGNSKYVNSSQSYRRWFTHCRQRQHTNTIAIYRNNKMKFNRLSFHEMKRSIQRNTQRCQKVHCTNYSTLHRSVIIIMNENCAGDRNGIFAKQVKTVLRCPYMNCRVEWNLIRCRSHRKRYWHRINWTTMTINDDDEMRTWCTRARSHIRILVNFNEFPKLPCVYVSCTRIILIHRYNLGKSRFFVF